MAEIVTVKGKDILIDREVVLKQINCTEDNPLYRDYLNEYDTLLPVVRDNIEPMAALDFAPFPDLNKKCRIESGAEVLLMIATAGEKSSKITDEFFEKGEHVKAMLSDAMSNSSYYAFEKAIQKRIREMCRKRGVGIKRRLEAPAHIPIEIHKYAFDILEADKNLGMSITGGFMFYPIKSSCQIFEVSDDKRQFILNHDCNECSRKDCGLRSRTVRVKVRDEEGDYEFSSESGRKLIDILRENEMEVDETTLENVFKVDPFMIITDDVTI